MTATLHPCLKRKYGNHGGPVVEIVRHLASALVQGETLVKHQDGTLRWVKDEHLIFTPPTAHLCAESSHDL